MANRRRVLSVALLLVGFALVVGGGLCAFYVVPHLEPRFRAPGGLLSIGTALAGLLLIISRSRRLESSAEPADEPHIPGLDAEVEEAGSRPPVA